MFILLLNILRRVAVSSVIYLLLGVLQATKELLQGPSVQVQVQRTLSKGHLPYVQQTSRPE